MLTPCHDTHAHQLPRTSALQVLLHNGHWLLDLAIACVMLAAVLLISVYVGVVAPAMQPQAAYSVYDGVETAQARWFLPRRSVSSEALAAAGPQLAAINSNSSAATVKPRKPLPTSPMKIRAGGAFQTRKPKQAPASSAQADANSL